MPSGNLFLWTPPPVVTDAVLEELLKARHKRTHTFLVVAVPRLMLPRWRCLFNKVCDFTFEVSPGTSFWPESMFEPIWVGIVLTFVKHRPWCLKQTSRLVELGIKLRYVLLTSKVHARDILRKLLLLPRRLDSVSERVAHGVLHMPG